MNVPGNGNNSFYPLPLPYSSLILLKYTHIQAYRLVRKKERGRETERVGEKDKTERLKSRKK
jgi:hypothetical protein